MSGVKITLSGSQKRKIRKEKEHNINSKYAKLDNFLISTSSSSCASASSSNDKRSKGNGCAIQHDFMLLTARTATAGSDVVQSGRPIFDDIFQHLWPYIGNNTANVVFQMVKRLWLIRIDQ
ncbi:hypothetical protein TNCV_1284851 [Trichonephila clavipes]|uniref:Uncharacterized protein n=1 Tax=Trichonephila clavipes TaxID=2585209 RepID=A0A8X6SR08_TRICX|nr:hypothetical protein TNCV_1284851 [Trichonephila clavipes]